MSDTKNNDLSTVDDFDALLNLVKNDASLIDKLTEEQVTALRKKINPYGRTIEGQDKFTCLSITNLSEQYMKRLMMTSLVGFVYRQCDEYLLSDGESTTPMDDFSTYKVKLDEAVESAAKAKVELADLEKDCKGTPIEDQTIETKARRLELSLIIERGEGYSKRVIVRQFIDSLFQFNPDYHVKSAYSDNPSDPERVKPKHVRRIITGRDGSTKELPNNSTSSDTTVSPDEVKSRETSEFVKHIPPSDTFHRWTYYMDSNFDEIRKAVTDIYSEKPDLEFAINPYNQFDSEEDAGKFIQKHKNEVIADVITLTNGKWNLCGSFKENRERINFYNDKTNVLEQIFKQIESDKKLGGDMMRKRVVRKKKKNIEESGAEPEAFKKYRKEHPSGFENMGAENIALGPAGDEKKTTVSHPNHEECPYDAVQVDVFDFRGGGQTVKKSEFFTQAEAPSVPASDE
jgi:hypothetical protein